MSPFSGGTFYAGGSMLYALPVDSRLTLAGGGTMSRLNVWGQPVTVARLDAMANYRISERTDATVYAIYNLTPGSTMVPFYDPLDPLARRWTVGSTFTFKVGDNVHLGFGVSVNGGERYGY